MLKFMGIINYAGDRKMESVSGSEEVMNLIMIDISPTVF